MQYTDDDRLADSISVYESNTKRFIDRYDKSDTSHMVEQLASAIPDKDYRPKVLDAGCGTGRDMATMLDCGLLPIGVDMSKGLLAEARHRLHSTLCELHEADIRHLPFADNSMDAVLANASMVHMSPDIATQALSEMHRVLITGHPILCTVQRKQSNGPTSGVQNDGRWFYYWETDEFVAVLESAGFSAKTPWADITTSSGSISGNWINALVAAA